MSRPDAPATSFGIIDAFTRSDRARPSSALRGPSWSTVDSICNLATPTDSGLRAPCAGILLAQPLRIAAQMPLQHLVRQLLLA
jgi:hypothetical protein